MWIYRNRYLFTVFFLNFDSEAIPFLEQNNVISLELNIGF